MKFDSNTFVLIAATVASGFSTATAESSSSSNNKKPSSGSILMDEPAGRLLAATHFGLDSTPLGYVPLNGGKKKEGSSSSGATYGNNDDDKDMYVSLANDSKRMEQAKEIATKFANKDKDTDNRKLVLNGHLSDILFEGCDAGYVYEHVTYDDAYQPVCQCLLDQSTGIIWMECYIGDEDCLDHMGTPDNAADDACSGTYEIFFFHEPTGDLESKATCTICHTPNCEAHGVNQVCTEVFFDADNVPNDCNLIRFPNGTVEVCEECNICGGPNAPGGVGGGSYGVQHICFGTPSDGCDTDTYSHLHNFEVGPSPYDGQPDVGGLFSQICNADSLDSMLYGDVVYDNSGSALCDCEDPASGTIACDLHDPACFANLCTTISEIFFFNKASGNFQFKWTVDWGEDFLWTETHFNTVTGQALNCSVLQPDPITGDLLQCINCEICDSAQEGKGIAYDCFGMTQDGTCDVANGRAKYNFDLPSSPTKPPVAPPTQPVEGLSPPTPAPAGGGKPSPPASFPTTTVNQNNNLGEGSGSGDNERNNVGIILGALFGGMAFAFLVVLIVRPRKQAVVMEPGDGDIDSHPSVVITDDGIPSYVEESQGEGVAVPGPRGSVGGGDPEIAIVGSNSDEEDPVENDKGILA